MLMEIDPLPMRVSMVMTMVMSSPSRREVSPAERLRRSPRLVPPRFRLVVAEFHPVSFLMIFPGQKTAYSRRWAPEACQGANKVGGAPSTLVAGWWPPSGTFFAHYFYIFQKHAPCSFRTFGVVQNRSLIFSPFPVQNSSYRHSPSSCKPYKIKEKGHKYCDILCNNIP